MKHYRVIFGWRWIRHDEIEVEASNKREAKLAAARIRHARLNEGGERVDLSFVLSQYQRAEVVNG